MPSAIQMKLWPPLRLFLLGVTLIGVIGVLGKALFFPPSEERNIANFDFPKTVPLSNWKLVDQEATDDPQGSEYQYQQGDTKLTISMQYVTHPHDNETLFRQYNPTSETILGPQTEILQQEEVGYYSISTTDDQAILTACISPRGGSVITYQQFIQGRYTSDLQLNRLLPWLLGQQPLRDHRCLWNQLSVPLNNSSPEKPVSHLEKTWFSWYKWWQAHYPEY